MVEWKLIHESIIMLTEDYELFDFISLDFSNNFMIKINLFKYREY